MCAEDEAVQIENLKAHGVTWNEVDLDAFTAACAPVYDWIVEEYNFVMDSDIVADIKARLAEENIHVLDTHYSFGFRSVVTNRDIYKPEDLNGVKLRATSSAMFTKTVECLGATPTPMSFTECLSAISSGVVEGFEGSTSTLPAPALRTSW